jgi:hypothetical protein
VALISASPMRTCRTDPEPLTAQYKGDIFRCNAWRLFRQPADSQGQATEWLQEQDTKDHSTKAPLPKP